MYDLIQSALTVAAEVTVIAGFAGIVAHALYTQHKSFMTEFCPPVAPCPPVKEVKVNGEVVLSGVVDTEYDDEPTEYGVEFTEKSPEIIAEMSVATQKLVTEAIPATDAALDSLKEFTKPRKSRTKKATKTQTPRKRKTA